MPRTILHLDLDAFFCAVEENLTPSLRGLPFAVGGKPEERGVVASCSYAARQFGVRSAMPMITALRLCPDLQIVSHHFPEYRQTSRQVMDLLHNLTPLVEQLSIDEAFLDVTGLPQPGAEVARNLQRTINETLNLPCSLGVASNKLVAKIANNMGKAGAKAGKPPNAIKIIPPGQEAAFLAPLPVQELWGVGPKTAERLIKMQLQTIGDLARHPERELVYLFGKLGADLSRRAKGQDDRPVVTERETKSISKEITFVRDVRDADELQHTLRQLSDGVGWELRHSGLSGTTVKIKLRWSDFTTLTRQVTLTQLVNQDDEIFAAALQLLIKVWPRGRPVRLLGVGISGLDVPKRQLSLWEDANQEQDRQLQATLDELRGRFGKNAIQRGSDLERPLDEDE